LVDNSPVNVSSTDFVVPNIMHYVWFTRNHRKQLLFLHYISVTSAYLRHRPQAIWFHCNHVPAGLWWDRLWSEVPIIQVYMGEIT